MITNILNPIPMSVGLKPNTIKILIYLYGKEYREGSVTKEVTFPTNIARVLDMSDTIVFKHLREMQCMGLVRKERRGKNVIRFLTDLGKEISEKIISLQDSLQKVVEYAH